MGGWGLEMDWRILAYWVIEVAGTFLAIAAFINLVLVRGDPLFYYFVLTMGLLIIYAGFPLRPKRVAGAK